ncbi:MAG: hypothetical protein ACTS3F_06585 [Phycisphaerales bacterium]
MVIRVVFALAAAALAVPALAADRLPYDIVNFTRTPAHAPQIGYDVGGLLYDRVPDHVALGYRLDGLTGMQPTYRVIRDYGPLDYDTDGLLAVIYASARQDGARSAAD